MEYRIAIVIRWRVARPAWLFGQNPGPPPWGGQREKSTPRGANHVIEMAEEFVFVVRGLGFTIGVYALQVVEMAEELVFVVRGLGFAI